MAIGRCERDALVRASFADGDTHLAEPAPQAHLVTAHCDGMQFRPLTVLPGAPPDQEQVCPTCRADTGIAIAAPALVAVTLPGPRARDQNDQLTEKARGGRAHGWPRWLPFGCVC